MLSPTLTLSPLGKCRTCPLLMQSAPKLAIQLLSICVPELRRKRARLTQDAPTCNLAGMSPRLVSSSSCKGYPAERRFCGPELQHKSEQNTGISTLRIARWPCSLRHPLRNNPARSQTPERSDARGPH